LFCWLSFHSRFFLIAHCCYWTFGSFFLTVPLLCFCLVQTLSVPVSFKGHLLLASPDTSEIAPSFFLVSPTLSQTLQLHPFSRVLRRGSPPVFKPRTSGNLLSPPPPIFRRTTLGPPFFFPPLTCWFVPACVETCVPFVPFPVPFFFFSVFPLSGYQSEVWFFFFPPVAFCILACRIFLPVPRFPPNFK